MRGGRGATGQPPWEWHGCIVGGCPHEAERGETASHADRRGASGVAALIRGGGGGFVEGAGKRRRGGASRYSQGWSGGELPTEVCRRRWLGGGCWRFAVGLILKHGQFGYIERCEGGLI